LDIKVLNVIDARCNHEVLDYLTFLDIAVLLYVAVHFRSTIVHYCVLYSHAIGNGNFPLLWFLWNRLRILWFHACCRPWVFVRGKSWSHFLLTAWNLNTFELPTAFPS